MTLNAVTQKEIHEYYLLCQQAAQSESAYRALRENALHQKVVEPFSATEGYSLQIEREALFPKVLYTQLSALDKTIKPPAHHAASKGLRHKPPLSPLALRHGQIAIELEREFGALQDLRILHIGAGFGQLAAHLAKTLGCHSYTLLDVPECIALQQKFLASIGVHHITYLTPSQLNLLGEYDLVICTFAFTEWGDAHLRDMLLPYLSKIPKGYITCHAPWQPSREDNSIEDALLLTLARAGHRVHCLPERGNPSPLHSVIRWGTEESPAPQIPSPTPSKSHQLGNAVVMNFDTTGRLGDKLLCFAHAKWIAHRYQLPLFMLPFPYAGGFTFSQKYSYLSAQFRYLNEVHPKNHREMSQALSAASTLFVIDFFAESDFESRIAPNTGAYFYTGWRDRGFLQSLREDLTPLVALEKPMLDDSEVHVAVHLRLGGGFDNPHMLKTVSAVALKSPQHAFYLQQIKRVAGFFPGKSIQVHLFTDDPNPKELAQKYEEWLKNPSLHVTYRTEKNQHDLHVLDDFFAMSAFDCLIYPQSYFSVLASQLGDFAVRITPIHASWKQTHWEMDQLECAMDGTHPLFQQGQ